MKRIGDKFGKLTVVSERFTKNGRSYVKCKCDCGTVKDVNIHNLGRNTKTCGCGKRLDLKNKRYGKLTAIKETGSGRNGYKFWECKCDCGNITNVRGSHLKAGHVKSCGCNRTEIDQDRVGYMIRAQYKQLRDRSHSYGRGEPTLTLETFKKLIFQDCFYCGCKPSREFKDVYRGKLKTNQTILVNGIDRFDNDQGYTEENSVPCCTECNTRKGVRPAEVYLAEV